MCLYLYKRSLCRLKASPFKHYCLYMFKETTRSLWLYGTLKNSAWDYWFQKSRHLQEQVMKLHYQHAICWQWNNSCITSYSFPSEYSSVFRKCLFSIFFPMNIFSLDSYRPRFVWYTFGELSGNLYLCPWKPMVMPLGYTPKIPCALTTSYLVSQVIFIMTSSTSVTAGKIRKLGTSLLL